MLKHLAINNIVLIDKAEIDFSRLFLSLDGENHQKSLSKDFSKLCILTGETGSGKSILLDALGLAIGFRSNSRLMGGFDNKASVIAEFEISNNIACQTILKENGLLDDENISSLRIRRIISENSSSSNLASGEVINPDSSKGQTRFVGKVFVNDNPVGVNLLARIGETLVEIHGQHEQRGLLSSTTHLQLLDEFADNNNLLTELSQNYRKLSEIDEQIQHFAEKKSQIEREKDYLSHVVSELESANIEQGEEEKLVLTKDLLAAKEKILSFMSEFKGKLLESSSTMFQAQKILLRSHPLIENYLPQNKLEFEEVSNKNDATIDQLNTSISWLENLIRKTSNNHENRDEIEERLFLIRSLARKFNTNPDGLSLVLTEANIKLEALSKQEQMSCKHENQRQLLFEEYQKISESLSKKRKQAAILLAQKVEEELKLLKMPNCKFRVELVSTNLANLSQNPDNKDSNQDEIQESETKFSFEIDSSKSFKKPTKNYFPSGNERAKFVAAINGEKFDEIIKIASGGELSRFMLALKVALMGVKSVPVMIFDEIDTGIGGATAEAVGKRLKILAQNLQILVVTHQAQIASKADFHLKVSKIANSNHDYAANYSDSQARTRTIIEILDQQQSLHEIARMLAGDAITDEAINAAKALMQ